MMGGMYGDLGVEGLQSHGEIIRKDKLGKWV
jgi:hypothetical protein